MHLLCVGLVVILLLLSACSQGGIDPGTQKLDCAERGLPDEIQPGFHMNWTADCVGVAMWMLSAHSDLDHFAKDEYSAACRRMEGDLRRLAGSTGYWPDDPKR